MKALEKVLVIIITLSLFFSCGGTNTVTSTEDGKNIPDEQAIEYSPTNPDNIDVVEDDNNLESDVNDTYYEYEGETEDVSLEPEVTVALEKAQKPIFNLSSGSYAGPQTVSVSCETSKATIYYSVNGEIPTTASNIYTEPIVIDKSLTLKAIAVSAGYKDSFVSEAAYSVVWAKTMGGESDEDAYSVKQTLDGGYIVTGYTLSFENARQASVVKLNAAGSIEWEKSYGGANAEFGMAIIQTNEGGFIFSGATLSFGSGNYDMWVVKLDSTGSVEWEKTYGGTNEDWATKIIQTQDGGFIVTGYTKSFGAGLFDILLIKLDKDGAIEWQKSYGGSANEKGIGIIESSAGYVLCGYTESFGAGSGDAWIISINNTGDVIWQKTYGGAGDDRCNSIIETSDNKLLVSGITSQGAGDYDIWIYQLSSAGDIEWEKAFGGALKDSAQNVIETATGDYLIAGYSKSFNTEVKEDVLLLKIDNTGNIIWQETYGGKGEDVGRSVYETSDFGYIVTGYSKNDANENADFLLLKLDSEGFAPKVISSDVTITLTNSTVGNSSVSANNTIAQAIETSATVQDTTSAFVDFLE